MINYDPLRTSLKLLNRHLKEIRDAGLLSSRTLAKISRNEPVNLRTIEAICLFYDLPIEQVVEIKKDDKEA